jgi:AraC family transcriptional regulator
MTKHITTPATVTAELPAWISADKLMAEALANSMAARLTRIDAPAVQSGASVTRGGLDQRRLSRVLDYIEANLEGDLSLDCMASIACLSRFHFSRAFRRAVGHPPHRYVSGRRLERAKVLLMQDDRSLVDIALALGFSCQSNFTRAFTQTMGLAPGQFRQEFRSRQRALALASLRISPDRQQQLTKRQHAMQIPQPLAALSCQ